MDDMPQMLERGDGVNGEIALRRRAGDDGLVIYELIVNGTFLMDTAETSTERLLADVLLDHHPAPRLVLVGGLGFGFTAKALLDSGQVGRVDIVEIEPLLVKWLQAGVVPEATPVVDHRRVRIAIDDIRAAIASAPRGAYDGILLDVDNGPDFLVHPVNAAVYRRPFLADCAGALAPGGMVAFWLAAPSTDLAEVIADTFGDVDEHVRHVRREGRLVDYHIYVGRRPRHSAEGTDTT